MRLRGLVRKEFYQVIRDPSSIGIAFLMPVVLLLVFGYGVSLDAEHVPLAMVIEQDGPEARSFVSGFEQNRYFSPLFVTGMDQAVADLAEHRVEGIVRLRSNFVEKLRGEDNAAVQVTLNGVDANTARLISGYVEGVRQKWVEQLAALQGHPPQLPVVVQQRIWYNSEVRSTNFIVPGLVAVIMILIGALLTAMIVAREWERGTMETLMATPVKAWEILLGKIIPYFLLGLGGLALSVAMAVWLFQVPLRGSIWVLVLCSALFLLASLGMGLLISIAARNQFIAGQIAIIVTFLPAFLLSGFIFDIGSMPTIVQAVTYLVAARYYVAILQTLFLAGNVWAVIWPNTLCLAVMAAVFLTLCRIRFKKRL
jgi:ABC-2 type transport system permease protein